MPVPEYGMPIIMGLSVKASMETQTHLTSPSFFVTSSIANAILSKGSSSILRASRSYLNVPVKFWAAMDAKLGVASIGV